MIDGEYWGKYLLCEGCGNRPTQCNYRKNNIKITLQIMGIGIIIGTCLGILFNIDKILDAIFKK